MQDTEKEEYDKMLDAIIMSRKYLEHCSMFLNDYLMTNEYRLLELTFEMLNTAKDVLEKAKPDNIPF